MTRSMWFCVLGLLLLVAPAASQGTGFGAGVIVGEPTGISLKNWLSRRTAFDIGVAWSFSNEDAVHIHADYLVHKFGVFKVEKGEMPLYFGIGGRIKFEDDVKVGVRIPIGTDYFFVDAPIDLFFEVVPLLELAPDTDVDVNAGLGIRYFF
jgi:hypothetical protein